MEPLLGPVAHLAAFSAPAVASRAPRARRRPEAFVAGGVGGVLATCRSLRRAEASELEKALSSRESPKERWKVLGDMRIS